MFNFQRKVIVDYILGQPILSVTHEQPLLRVKTTPFLLDCVLLANNGSFSSSLRADKYD